MIFSSYPLEILFESPAAGFTLSYILNMVYFGVIGYVIIRPQMRKTTLHKFLLGTLGLTGASVAANMIPFYIFGIADVASFVPHFLLGFVLLAVINFALARHHFKAPAAGSVAIGLIMAVLANGYLTWLI